MLSRYNDSRRYKIVERRKSLRVEEVGIINKQVLHHPVSGARIRVLT